MSRQPSPRTYTLVLLGALSLAACASPEAAHKEPAAAPPTVSTPLTVLVKARFKSDDAAENRKIHDEVAAGGREAAASLGDTRHLAWVGLEDPRTFLAIDLWSDPEGLDRFFQDPAFGRALSAAFDGAPAVDVYAPASGWVSWGTLAPQPGDLVATVEGTLVSESAAENQRLHDEVAGAGKEVALSLGDVAHLVHTGAKDPRRFLAIDVWRDAEGMKQFFANPQIQESFATLFAAPPTVTVYRDDGLAHW